MAAVLLVVGQYKDRKDLKVKKVRLGLQDLTDQTDLKDKKEKLVTLVELDQLEVQVQVEAKGKKVNCGTCTHYFPLSACKRTST